RRKSARYLMPLMIKWHRFDRDKRNPSALCAVRRSAREGILVDAASDTEFIGAMLENVRTSAVFDAHSGQHLEFHPIGNVTFAGTIENVRAVDTEQSNTSVLVDSDCVVKLFRRVEPGINPEIEVGRFLTETVGFPNTPPLLGTV